MHMATGSNVHSNTAYVANNYNNNNNKSIIIIDQNASS